MKNFCLALFFLLILVDMISAQEDVNISKKEFKVLKPGFKVAWKHIKEGDAYYSDGGRLYMNALEEYLKANEYNNGNDALNYKIGVSYLFSDNKDNAYEFLIKAFNINNNVSSDILFLTGMSLQYAGRYRDAVDKYLTFLSGAVRKSDNLIARANKRLDECKSALEITKDTLPADIQNAGEKINSYADEYSEILTSDGKKLYFASRKAIDPNARNYYKDSKLDENIYISENLGGNWNEALPGGKNLMTAFCETPLFIDRSGEVIYVYVGYEGNGDIKYSELKKGEWKPLKGEPFGLNSKDPETSFCISPSGEEIAFVSDRGTSGFGGKDIFFVKRNGQKWSKPVNAGEKINTMFNEESVRYSVTGDTLWFSSTGHNTIGGFDIFFSIRNSENSWGPAVNAGYPINTPWNDLFYIPSPVNRGEFFFVSDRSGGFGGLDLYTGNLDISASPVVPQTSPAESNADSLLIRKSAMAEIMDQEPGRQDEPDMESESYRGGSDQAVTDNSSTGRKALSKK